MSNAGNEANWPKGFVFRQAKDARYTDDGLRSFFEYRRMNIADATDGRVNAHILKAKPGQQGQSGRHYHTMESELVFVLKGYNRIDFEGIGILELRAGDFMHVPKGTVHNVLEFSDDLEILTIQIPAAYDTVAVE